MTYAFVLSGAITAEGNLPSTAKRLDTGQWVTPPNGVWTDAQASTCGWLPVTDAARPADTQTTTSDRTVALVAGIPTVVWTVRPWTATEFASKASVVDLTARVARLEALVQPAPPAPTVITDPTVPTWATLNPPNVWPNGGLLLDGSIYRNVSGVPLTTQPSQFPGSPSQWTNLFVVALAAPVTGAWSGAGVAYKIGDQVTYLGHAYKCIQAHTSQAAWTPVAVPSLWTLVS